MIVILEISLLLFISIPAVYMDFSTGKVSNHWICLAWAAGIFYTLTIKGPPGLQTFFLGALVPLFLLFPLFLFRMLGPGDIKLFSALGGVMGFPSILSCILLSFILGSVLSLAILSSVEMLCLRLRYFTRYIRTTLEQHHLSPYYLPGNQPENIHFTVPILMGVILYAGGFY